MCFWMWSFPTFIWWSRSHAISSFGVRSIWGRFAPFMSQASSIVQPTSSDVSPPLRKNGWLHPKVLQLFWKCFGDAQVDLFASPDISHCQLFYSLSEGTLGTDALAHSWPRGLRKYVFPPVSLLAQTLCKVREDEEQVLLVSPYWPNRTWFPELMILATAPPFSERGHPLAPASRLVDSPHMVPGRDAEVLGELPPVVVNTRLQTRLQDTLTGWSGTCSSIGVLPAGRTPVDARSQSCSLSCKMGWSEGCLPPPSKCMLP